VSVTIEQLRALAEGATPGPWRAIPDPGEHLICEACGDEWTGDSHAALIAHSGKVGLFLVMHDARDDANAAYLAALSPEVVLDLLDQIERRRFVVQPFECMGTYEVVAARVNEAIAHAFWSGVAAHRAAESARRR
jgi:hypothetical protein